MYMNICMYIHICIHICMCMCIYKYVYVCMCICIYAYIINIYPPDPMNHVKKFKGWPRGDASWEWYPRWYT